jgi:NAD-dependent deacetylase
VTPLPSGVIDAMRSARAVVVLTGAGVSAESGIPTFRDRVEGLWAQYNPADLATPEAFERDPKLVSRWYEWRMSTCASCEPNAGHIALARWESWLNQQGGRWTLLTQNVDGLHQRAGSRNVLELHGTVGTWRCCACGAEEDAPNMPFETHPPGCSECGGPRRPGVVWFGESLPAGVLETAGASLSSCDLFLSVGTSSMVQPSASFVHVAMKNGATTIELNPSPTPISEIVDHAIAGPSGRLLEEWVAEAFGTES